MVQQGETRNFSGPKRPRTDGTRNEGDWKCPSCGNLNFAFRTTCNMRNCSTPKPADQPPKSFGGYVPSPYGQGQPAFHLGPPAAAASMYLGGQGTPPPYGASMAFGGPSAVTYDMSFAGAGMRYDYGHLSPGGPYGALHMPPPYGHAAVVGPGAYGAGPLVDGYGMGMSLGRGMGMRPFPEENGSRKRRGDGLTDGDWVCPKCGNTNFSFRTICNMRKCGTPKPNDNAPKSGAGSKASSKSTPPEGSWTCEKCGNINYPFRQKCNKSNCGAEKPTEKSDTAKSQDENEQ